MRRDARADENQSKIVKALRQCYMTVTPTHMVGRGFPDIVVGFQGVNYLFELKKNHKEKLTPAEQEWHDDWRGQIDIVTDIDEIMKIIEVKR